MHYRTVRELVTAKCGFVISEHRGQEAVCARDLCPMHLDGNTIVATTTAELAIVLVSKVVRLGR